MFRPILSAAALAGALALVAGGAAASGAPDNATQERIRATLTEQGYEVRKIDMEDGKYEAYALKDGQRFEIYMNSDLEVIETKKD